MVSRQMIHHPPNFALEKQLLSKTYLMSLRRYPNF